jgi:osmoprotectant transport system ATP-binding protein
LFARLDKTLVLVTHDIGKAQFFASRIVLLRADHIERQGPYDELIAAPVNDLVVEFLEAQGRLHRTGDAAVSSCALHAVGDRSLQRAR